jgi:hypothetical protein
MTVIEIKATGLFHAQADDGRAFLIFEYTEYRFFEKDDLVVGVATRKFFETADGDEVTSSDGRFHIAGTSLAVPRSRES